MKNAKSLQLFGEVNFQIIANKDAGNFVHFWQFFPLGIHMFQLLEKLET